MLIFSKPTGTNVPGGDKDKEVTRQTTQRGSYLQQQPSYVPYSKGDVIGKLQKTNFSLVDGLGTFDTYKSTATDSYKPKSPTGELKFWTHT